MNEEIEEDDLYLFIHSEKMMEKLGFNSENIRNQIQDEIDSFVSKISEKLYQCHDSDVTITINEILKENKTIRMRKRDKIKLLIILVVKLVYLWAFLNNKLSTLIFITDYMKIKNVMNVKNFESETNETKKRIRIEIFVCLFIICSFLSFECYGAILNHFSSILLSFGLKFSFASSRRTMGRRLKIITEYYQERVKEIVKDSKYFSISYDCVKDSVGNEKYLAVILDTVDKNGNKNKLLLDLQPFSGTSTSLNNCLFSIFKQYGINSNILYTKLTSVSSDNGGESKCSRKKIKDFKRVTRSLK